MTPRDKVECSLKGGSVERREKQFMMNTKGLLERHKGLWQKYLLGRKADIHAWKAATRHQQQILRININQLINLCGIVH